MWDFYFLINIETSSFNVFVSYFQGSHDHYVTHKKNTAEIFRLKVFTGELNKGNNSGDKLQCIDWGLFLSHLGLQCGKHGNYKYYYLKHSSHAGVQAISIIVRI